jgi:KDO2-lipid IV(A) lauroyltransferase
LPGPCCTYSRGRLSRFDVARANLRIAFGEDISEARIEQIIRGMWTHLFRMITEMVQLPGRFRLETCAEILQFEKRNECVQALLSDRPVLLLEATLATGKSVSTPLENLGFPWVSSRGISIIPGCSAGFCDTGSPVVIACYPNPGLGRSWRSDCLRAAWFRCCAIRTRDGAESLWISSDVRHRHSNPSRCWRLQFNALIIVGGAWRLPADAQKGARWVRFCLTTEDIIDPQDFQSANAVEQITQRYTAALEALIRRAPEQYFWVHRRWKTPPGPRRRKPETAVQPQ